MSKPALTRRVRKLYNAIVGGIEWSEEIYFKGLKDRRYRRVCWGAYHFAKRWQGRGGFHMWKLQLIVIRSEDATCAYAFARDVRGAKVDRLQKVVIEHGSPQLMRDFACNVPGADVQHLKNLAMIGETMAM